MYEDEFVIRGRVGGSGTGGQIPDVAHHVRFIKLIIESAVKRGDLPDTLRVVGFEIHNAPDSELVLSKPRKPAG